MSLLRRLALTAIIAVLVDLGILSAASVATSVYLPAVRAQSQFTGVAYPPHGTSCLLQTSGSSVIDPRTGVRLVGCESKNGHGYIVYTTDGRLLLDHVAAGSGSLSVDNGTVYVTAIREDGGAEIQEVPAP